MLLADRSRPTKVPWHVWASLSLVSKWQNVFCYSHDMWRLLAFPDVKYAVVQHASEGGSKWQLIPARWCTAITSCAWSVGVWVGKRRWQQREREMRAKRCSRKNVYLSRLNFPRCLQRQGGFIKVLMILDGRLLGSAGQLPQQGLFSISSSLSCNILSCGEKETEGDM